jgi:N-acetyl-D-muramate 6-phosphate phosphatase
VKVEAVLLDLDGTLVDTAPDLVRVLNHLLTEDGRPKMPYALARNEASNGAAGLLKLGYGTGQPDDRMAALRARFLDFYAKNLCIDSRIFMDMRTFSKDHHEMRWGIVTNKPDALTVRLLASLGIRDLPACVISGDRLPQRKPHPAPLTLAASELGVDPAHCVYVGDAPRDIEAGRAAGMATIAAAYGYIRPSEDIESWGADLKIKRPGELGDALAALADGASR